MPTTASTSPKIQTFSIYFEQATPVNELENARIGSRPTRRTKSRGLDDLRAIPWVFGWMQSRHAVPAWFGVGYAIERFRAKGRTTKPYCATCARASHCSLT